MLGKKESKGTRDKAQGRNKEQGTRKIQDSRYKSAREGRSFFICNYTNFRLRRDTNLTNYTNLHE